MNSPGKILLVTGGGAAGLFCAVNAARLDPSLKVIVAEKSGKLLSKLRISGGGRCNLTHACTSIAEMAKQYPRGAPFVKKAFHRFFVPDTEDWFQQRGVPLKTEDDGRMFPQANTSQAIIDCLLREVNQYGVEIRMNREVAALKLIKNEESASQQIEVSFSNGERLLADYVCVACGGFPKVSQFDWLIRLGHSVEVPVPSLFTFNLPGHSLNQLMGVSVADAQIKITGTRLQERGPVLITHWGLSGPAILRLSAWGARELAACQYACTIMINWLPEWHEQSAAQELQRLRFERAPQKVAGKNVFGLPSRLWEWLTLDAGIDAEMRWADLPVAKQNKLARNLCAQSFSIQGKTTFKEEFVTAGGIRLSEIDPATMQSKKIPALYFAGEIMDVDGVTGGYNFQHAWTSGFIAASSVAADSRAAS